MSPFDRRISDEWDALSFSSNPEMPVAERERRAKALHASCLDGAKWNVSAADAGLATYHVVVTALQGRRYDEAVDYCIRYLAHPHITSADKADIEEFTLHLGSGYVLRGDVDLGLKTFGDFIGTGRRRKQTRRHLVRNHLLHVLEIFGAAATADERVVTFVSDLLRGWKGQARKCRLVLKAQTNGDLIDVLMSTYPQKRSAGFVSEQRTMAKETR